MIDTAQLREALDRIERKGQIGSGYMTAVKLIADAARELLTLREAGALIITPDEDGEWPLWALNLLLEAFSRVAMRGHVEHPSDLLDALRDAKPDGDS